MSRMPEGGAGGPAPLSAATAASASDEHSMATPTRSAGFTSRFNGRGPTGMRSELLHGRTLMVSVT